MFLLNLSKIGRPVLVVLLEGTDLYLHLLCQSGA